MKLVAPNVGWAETERFGRSLFWTTDGGAHWRDITPNPFANSEAQKLEKFTLPYGVEQASIADVFFLDTHRGWVLFCCSYPRSTKRPDQESAQPDEQSPHYDLAMTTDSGASWSIANVTLPDEVESNLRGDALGGTIAFADSLHGWMNLTECGGHTCSGTLLTTSDGGRTWRAAHEGPPAVPTPFPW